MSQVKDPVCGMIVDTESTKFKSEHEGHTYYFCAPGCKTAFDKDPKKYVTQDQSGNDHRDHNHGHV